MLLAEAAGRLAQSAACDNAARMRGSLMPGGAVEAIGLMSGTSLDGVDAALVVTDGEGVARLGPALTLPYDEALRARLRALLGKADPNAQAVAAAERELTQAHAAAVRALLAEAGRRPGDIGVIGFHGQTLLHRPECRRTWQMGDGAWLARDTGIPVVNEFRAADVAAGGQGAPLVPLYHAALARDLPRPLAVLNLGGVGNVTWIGEGDALLAFDTGPGNALIDDWARRHTGQAMDRDGALARAGRVDEAAVAAFRAHDWFRRPPPKSLDRDDFQDFAAGLVAGKSPADGAATLTALTTAAVAEAPRHFPAPPRQWLVTGGGRRNAFLMERLAEDLAASVRPVEAVGWDGDALEAQAFAFLAVRSRRGLPLTLPGTTGVAAPTRGGRLWLP